MEAEFQDVTHRKIAFFYRDERTLLYFFVCHQCNGCYETINEIIQHVELRCRKNVKSPSVEIIEADSNLQSDQNCSKVSKAHNNNNYTAIKIVATKDLVQKRTLDAVDKNASLTIPRKTPKIHILGNELINGPTIIDISDEDSTDVLPTVHQSLIPHTSVSNDTATVNISNDEPEPSKTPTNDISDDGKIPIEVTNVCEADPSNNVAEDKTIVDISDDEIITQPSKIPFIKISDEWKTEELPKVTSLQVNNMDFNILPSYVSSPTMEKFQNTFENDLIEHVRQNATEAITKAIDRVMEDITKIKQIDGGRSYFCKICSFQFLNQNDFERHLENHRAYCRCMKCSEFLETPARLATHLMQKHDKITKPKCKYCCRLFKYFNSLEKHLFDAHNNEITSSKLPINAKIRPEIYQCDYCKREFYSKESLKKHLSTMHLTSAQRGLNSKTNFNKLDGARINPDISEWDEGILVKNFDTFLDSTVTASSSGCFVDYVCKICDFQSNEIMKAALHICQIHKKQLYQVAVNKFHEVDITDNWNLPFNNPIVCKFCTTVFSTKFGYVGLYQHILLVHNEISCNQCSLTFKEYHQFHAHYIEHYRAGAKHESAAENLLNFIKEKTIFDEHHHLPYLCLICGKRHIDMNKISEHVRTHICKISKVRIVEVSQIFKTLPSEHKMVDH